MDTVNYTSFRENMAGFIDKVNEDHSPVIITRQNAKPAVLMSLEDFNAYEEMAYLRSSPNNIEDLDRAIEQIETGNAVEHDLIR